ncbi:helix-turn-helix domain-containing protein [Taibaiella chishuiensis]|uniref:AraC family transcriptional activator of pobA n=1 Tax=Taibaiella chishuiensis TaxID=1434707 RepID=A0A2P8D5Z1_9BACT|nr:AraC family transcriptional regulator [Taibaiella chishuiensis]PSK92634.1 AraC family transcriptional activator of pobA [Taibaiella chishuiensis]
MLDREELVQRNYQERGVYNTDFFEILFFKKASGTLLLNDRRIELTDDTIVFVSAFQKRQWLTDNRDLAYTTLIFQEDFLNEFFADKFFIARLLYFCQLDRPLILPVPAPDMARYCGMLQEIKRELVQPQTDSAHIIRSLLYYLLQTLNRAYAGHNQLALGKEVQSPAYRFRRLLELHIREEQRLVFYTDALGISSVALNNAVKRQFGLTAGELLKQRLVVEIKNDLIYSGKTLAEIAAGLHFPEPNHLMRFFKTQTGQTTGAFLSAFQNDSL